MRSAIDRLLKDDLLRRKMGERARERVRCEFSLERMAKNVEAVCKDVLRSATSASPVFVGPQRHVTICSAMWYSPLEFIALCCEREGTKVRRFYYLDEDAYRKMVGKSLLSRLAFRFSTYVIFPLRLANLILFGCTRDTTVIATTNPFFAPALAALAARPLRRTVIHLLFDLYPDALEVAGKISRGGLASRFLGSITRYAIVRCHATVFVGDVLRAHAERRWGTAPIGTTIDIGVDTNRFPVRRNPHRDYSAKRIGIRYGGQLGYMHDALTLICCVKEALKDATITESFQFDFYVSGVYRTILQKELADTPARVQEALPKEDWHANLMKYDIGLVSLSHGGATVALPNKVYAMMAAGQAVIALCPPWSDLGKMTTAHDAGWVVSNSPFPRLEGTENMIEKADRPTEIRTLRPESIAEAFLNVLREIVGNDRLLAEKQANALHAASRNFGLTAIAPRWQNLLSQT